MLTLNLIHMVESILIDLNYKWNSIYKKYVKFRDKQKRNNQKKKINLIQFEFKKFKTN